MAEQSTETTTFHAISSVKPSPPQVGMPDLDGTPSVRLVNLKCVSAMNNSVRDVSQSKSFTYIKKLEEPRCKFWDEANDAFDQSIDAFKQARDCYAFNAGEAMSGVPQTAGLFQYDLDAIERDCGIDPEDLLAAIATGQIDVAELNAKYGYTVDVKPDLAIRAESLRAEGASEEDVERDRQMVLHPASADSATKNGSTVGGWLRRLGSTN